MNKRCGNRPFSNKTTSRTQVEEMSLISITVLEFI